MGQHTEYTVDEKGIFVCKIMVIFRNEDQDIEPVRSELVMDLTGWWWEFCLIKDIVVLRKRSRQTQYIPSSIPDERISWKEVVEHDAYRVQDDNDLNLAEQTEISERIAERWAGRPHLIRFVEHQVQWNLKHDIIWTRL